MCVFHVQPKFSLFYLCGFINNFVLSGNGVSICFGNLLINDYCFGAASSASAKLTSPVTVRAETEIKLGGTQSVQHHNEQSRLKP